MCHRRIIISLLVGLFLPVAVTAQMHSAVELSVGGGWSTLGYKVQPSQAGVDGSSAGSWGLQAHVGYAFFFTPHVGLGVGANFSHYGADASLTGTAQWEGVTDTNGETYNHLTLIHSLKDKQDIYSVEIPLTLYFLIPLSDYLNLDIQVGAKYALPVLSKASFNADVEHQGDYGIWGLTLYDVTGHGFYREKNFYGSYSIAAKNQVSAFLKVGLSYEIKRDILLFGNIYGDYGFINSLRTGAAELGFQNDRAGMEETHSFMPAYNGIITTKTVSDKSHPVQIGLEVGVRFVFPHRKSYPCLCDRYQ